MCLMLLFFLISFCVIISSLSTVACLFNYICFMFKTFFSKKRSNETSLFEYTRKIKDCITLALTNYCTIIKCITQRNVRQLNKAANLQT